MSLRWTQRLALVLAYVALLVYGTWFPLDRWDWTLGGWETFVAVDWLRKASRPDIIINIVVYVPFGALVAQLLRSNVLLNSFAACLLGFALSALLEFGQTYLPGRVTSGMDIILNTAGSVIGALISVAVLQSEWLQKHRQRVIAELRSPGTGHLGLLVLALWVTAQWAPWVPSLDLSTIKQGLSLFRTLPSASELRVLLRTLEYFTMLLGLLALGLHLFKDREAAARWLLLMIGAVLVGKILILTRQLAPEAVLAAALTAILALFMRGLRSAPLQALALAMIVAHHTIATFVPAEGGGALRSMNWIPFRDQMNSVNGIIDLVSDLWLFAALAYLMYPRRHRTSEGLALRLTLVAPWALVLEWGQQSVPGRYADITDVVVGVAAFTLAYSFPWRRIAQDGMRGAEPNRPHPRWHRALLATTLFVAVMLLAGRLTEPDEVEGYALPTVDSLPNPPLKSFGFRHPRLPAPDSDTWDTLVEENPRWVEAQRAQAQSGDLYARILIARTEPERIDLGALFNELIGLQFDGRGHAQTIPVALAYDWLYDRWTASQRARLLQKSEQACTYQVRIIRDEMALSPYNVYLYNSPLQALMMSALAIYGDSTDGQCMRFTHDYWRNRVLPVWRQVMGRRGGWHEGGEYVGIGIGQAIHRLPAMWREATGEDLFATHPGIRGFTEFALQRQRPDGTDMRLGDIAYVDREIPDLAPLALELRHSAAYTAANPPREPTPLGFPWGPLSDNSLLDPDARARLPTAHWFDGIGLLVARSDWSGDATYLTAKAGNNYWSHMHLDQGAFTIFKGGALAIDSGVYFDYGGDHHMNYTYQSIAHNVVTVFDPDDNAPMRGRERTNSSGETVRDPERAIANDGGQRRVGSGWGNSAPLDVTDWKQQREEYRTVGAARVDTNPDDGLVWLNADLTPAYTNEASARGEFAARTRRVERYHRSIVYLPRRDLILVHDRLRFTRTSLRSRWLLHSVNRPSVDDTRFSLAAGTGQLEGQVLLPLDPIIQPIGGEGFEFFVGDRNYGQGGAALASAAKRPGIEPGAWRLEIQPGGGSREMEFLVALRPSLRETPLGLPAMRVLDQGDHLEVHVDGDKFGDTITVSLPRAVEDLQALP